MQRFRTSLVSFAALLIAVSVHGQNVLSRVLTSSGSGQAALQSTPTLQIFVYGFPQIPASIFQDAENEAARMLRPARIELEWINCTSRLAPAVCSAPQYSNGLIIRIIPTALPQASVRALGIAGFSADCAAAFIFYDRILALRTHTRLLQVMLGRVMAHEITHMLLPREDHSHVGLMRGLWSTDDFRQTSFACLGLSSRAALSIHQQVLQRMAATGGTAKQ